MPQNDKVGELPPMPSELLLLAKDSLLGPALIEWGRRIIASRSADLPQERRVLGDVLKERFAAEQAAASSERTQLPEPTELSKWYEEALREFFKTPDGALSQAYERETRPAHLFAIHKVAERVAALSANSPSNGPLTLDTERQVFFYEQDHYYLSNFSAFKVRFRDVLYDTSEHAYQAQKFLADESRDYRGELRLRWDISGAASAHDAFKLAERNSGRRHQGWDALKVQVMREILRAKAAQHEYVSRKLLQTGDRELVENSWRDAFWGWGPNRDGLNMLGKLWMEVRAELRGEAEGRDA